MNVISTLKSGFRSIVGYQAQPCSGTQPRELPARAIQRTMAELDALSDEELARRGLKRCDIGYAARYRRQDLASGN